MYAYAGVLAALLARTSTHEGSTIEVSLFDALGEWMSAPMYYARYGGAAPVRSGANHASIAPYGAFTAGDGPTVLLGIQNAREWQRFCELVLERPDLTADDRFRTNPLRVTHRAALSAEIDGVFQRLTTAQIIERLDAAGIANARLNDIAAFAAHPQLTARHRWSTIDSPNGPIDVLQPPVIVEGARPAMGPIPALGEHTAAILSELGFDGSSIAAWKEKGLL
jgi:itaconate CoA-transferase